MSRAALLVAACALVAPAVARAELVAPGVASGALAVARDGSPFVAYVRGRSLFLTTRTSGWRSERAAVLPAAGTVAGIAVDGSGRVAVLAEGADGRWLVLYERSGKLVRFTSLLPRLAAGARIGRAGLAFDRRGLPVVAYAEWQPSGKTFLRLVRFERGRYRAHRVTRRGFPPSQVAPSAAPVLLPNGAVRVVEAYGAGAEGSAAIDWMPQRNDWLGQFIYSSPLAALAGGVQAVAGAAGVYAAWTIGFPQLGKLAVVLAHHGTPVETALAREDSVLAGLALGPSGPLLATTDVVPAGDGVLTAAVLRDAAGKTVELDGAAVGVAAPASGVPQVLLARDAGLEWYATRAGAPPEVTLGAARVAEGVSLSGSVPGVTDGTVTIYRERPGEPRVTVASAPLSPDGSFTALDPGAPSGAFYRTVYVEPTTGLPVASLLRSAVSG
ncbi:MAG TPA: hypothetical protein VF101_15885 [Gaiellaceae bacterium]